MLQSNTMQIQSELGKYVRDGKTEINGSLRKERLHHYRRLVRNIVDGALSSAYPITLKILDDREWQKLIDDFMVQHSASDPQVWRYPKELIDFFENSKYHINIFKKEYLLDLLKFEWMEMEVHGMKDQNIEEFSFNFRNNLSFYLNPHFKIEHFQYPVHKKNYKDIEKEIGNYFVMCYRRSSDQQVRYLSLSGVDALIFEALQEKFKPDEIVKNLINMLNESEDNILNYLQIFIKNYREKELTLTSKAYQNGDNL